ncbi:MAG: LytR/AlgR family response regulator transcription factor [Cytophagaceae bacterium]
MIRALIIDDAENARAALKGDIDHYCKNVRVVAEADSVESGFRKISDYAPDLVFLDIRMADGTGFDLLEKLKSEGLYKLRVVFTTAYDQYAIKAFKYSAVDYLLKPVDPEELIKAVQKVKDASENVRNDNLDFLLQSVRKKTVPDRLALNSQDKVQVVNIPDIIRCESQRNYTLFYLTGNRQVLVTKTLKEYDEMLEDNGFVRVHHSHLINLAHLKEFVKNEGGMAVMSDKSQVPVSTRKREQLLKILGL